MNNDQKALADGSELTAKTWFLWYFRRDGWSLITIPLFLLFTFALATSIVGALVHSLALLRATYAVWGFVGSFLVISIGWVIVIIPPSLYYSLMKNVPGAWMRRDVGVGTKLAASAFVIVVFPLFAYLVYHAITFGIGWIADRDPCAAYAAGVTGSIVPVNCG